MATVEVLKPKPKLVLASSVKGYRPDRDGFVNAPELRDAPSGFVLKTGPRKLVANTSMPTKAPGAILKPRASGLPDRVPPLRGAGFKVGKADQRFVSGKGRTIIPNIGVSLANSNGAGI